MIQIRKRSRSQDLLFYSEDLRKGVEPLIRLVSISFTVTKKNDLTCQVYTSLQMSPQSSLRVFRVLVETQNHSETGIAACKGLGV